MKKLSVILLVLVFVLVSIIGCQQASNVSEDSSSKDTSTSDKSNENLEASEEPVKLVFYQNNGAGTGVGSEAGSTKEAYEMVQNYILEHTGILLESIKAPSEGADEKLAMLLASGEQLDLWFGSTQTYSSRGAIQPLNDLLELAPAVKEAWDPWDAWSGVTDKDGNIWGVPRMTPTTPYPIFVRQDWLKELGAEQPKNMEELNELLYLLKKEDPYGNGRTIPLITRGQNLNALEMALVGGYVETGRGPWIDENGNVMPLQLADGYVDFLEQVRKWYADGILHAENFGWNTPAVREQIARGTVGVTATWYSDVTLQAETLEENVPGASFDIYEPGLTGPNGQLIQTRANGSVNGLLLSSKCENPEAAMKLINWFYEDWENYQTGMDGIKDVHWKYVDGTNVEDRIVEDITTVEGGGTGYYSDFSIAIGLPMETQSKAFNKDGKRNMHNFWVAEHLDDFDATKAPLDYGIFFNSIELEENIPTMGDISRVMNEELIKFVTGSRPLSEYDQFIQELYDVGLDDWIAEYTRQYKLLTE